MVLMSRAQKFLEEVGKLVIGKTQSGKDIYRNALLPKNYKGYSKQDHLDAADLFAKLGDKEFKAMGKIKAGSADRKVEFGSKERIHRNLAKGM